MQVTFFICGFSSCDNALSSLAEFIWSVNGMHISFARIFKTLFWTLRLVALFLLSSISIWRFSYKNGVIHLVLRQNFPKN